jgi:hypothetical protein
MNIYIIIFIIIIILFILISFKTNFNKNNEHYSAESLINIFAPCKDVVDGTVYFNNLNIDGTLKLGGTTVKNMKQYLLDVLFPIGSYYVQYPDKNSSLDYEAFPIDKSPGRLFGGDWLEQWSEESIFFRTRGPESRENRVNGFQGDAIKMFAGKSAFNQTNLANPGLGNTGIFGGGISTMVIGTDADMGDDVGHVNYFDSSVQSNMSKLETRVRNRQIKVWKRIKRENNGNLPSPPEFGYDPQYDNIYFDGPFPNNTFLNTKRFNVFDRINTHQKAMQKCKELGDECKAIGLIKEDPKVYNYSSSDAIINNAAGDNSTNLVWFKKKSETVL